VFEHVKGDCKSTEMQGQRRNGGENQRRHGARRRHAQYSDFSSSVTFQSVAYVYNRGSRGRLDWEGFTPVSDI
jgi:hypothetical protein